jgi:hypothetical protein
MATHLEGTKKLRPAVQRGRNTGKTVVVVVAALDQALARRDLGAETRALRAVGVEYRVRAIAGILGDRRELSVRFSQPYQQTNEPRVVNQIEARAYHFRSTRSQD